MTNWISVPECPDCGDVMRRDEEDESYFSCTGCFFVASKFDLDFLYTSDG